MTRPTNTCARAAFVAIVALLVVSPAARGDRDVIIPGTACKPGAGDRTKINYSATSAINEASSQATVYCPFNYPTDPEHAASNVFIRVIDRDAGAESDTHNIVCQLVAVTHDGPGSVFRTTVKSSHSLNPGSPSPIQDLDDPSGDGIEVIAVPGLVYSLKCTLPAATSLGKSEVVDYQMDPVHI
jgi:hypothetical protein